MRRGWAAAGAAAAGSLATRACHRATACGSTCCQIGLPLGVVAHLGGHAVEVADQALEQVFLHRQAAGQVGQRVAEAQHHVVGDVVDLRQPGLRLVARGRRLPALPDRRGQSDRQAGCAQHHRRTGQAVACHQLGQQVASVGRSGAHRITTCELGVGPA
jgi:hypothetical protein